MHIAIAEAKGIQELFLSSALGCGGWGGVGGLVSHLKDVIFACCQRAHACTFDFLLNLVQECCVRPQNFWWIGRVFSPVLGKVVYRFFSMSIWVLTVLMCPLHKTLK